ncbi:MAG: hypothetical protein K2Y21_00960 [Phycisphaerales bacterium]|nr:hypothetical protein [Phycisphaerales bacterium]
MFRRLARFLFRHLSTPASSVVLLLLLALCLWRVPSADVSTASIRGNTIPGLKVGTAHRLGTISLFVIKDSGRFRVEDTDTQSTDGLIAALRRDPDDVLRANISYQRVARGWLDVVRFDDLYELDFRPVGRKNPSDADVAAARAAVLGWLDSHDQGNKPRIAAALRNPEAARHEWNTPGVVNTAALVLFFVLLLISFAWVPRVVRDRRAARRARAIAQGLCPRCGYALGGLPTCPECGERLAVPGAGESSTL